MTTSLSRVIHDRILKKPEGKAMVSLLYFRGATADQVRSGIARVVRLHELKNQAGRRIRSPQPSPRQSGPPLDLLSHFNEDVFSTPLLPVDRLGELTLLTDHFGQYADWQLKHMELIGRHWPGIDRGIQIVQALRGQRLSPRLLSKLAQAGIDPVAFSSEWARISPHDPALTPEKLVKEWESYALQRSVPATEVSQRADPSPQASSQAPLDKPAPDSLQGSSHKTGKPGSKGIKPPSESPSPPRQPRDNGKLLAQLNEELTRQGLDVPLARLLGRSDHQIQPEHISALSPASRLDPAQQVRVHALRILEALRRYPPLRDATAIQVAQHTHQTALIDPHHLRMVGEAAEATNSSVQDVVAALRQHGRGAEFERDSQAKLFGRIRDFERHHPEGSVFRRGMTQQVARILAERA